MKNGRIRVLKIYWGRVFLLLFPDSNVTNSVNLVFSKGYFRLSSYMIRVHSCYHLLLSLLCGFHDILQMIILWWSWWRALFNWLIPISVLLARTNLPFGCKSWFRGRWRLYASFILHDTFLPRGFLQLFVSCSSGARGARPSINLIGIISFLIIRGRGSHPRSKKTLTLLIILILRLMLRAK